MCDQRLRLFPRCRLGPETESVGEVVTEAAASAQADALGLARTPGTRSANEIVTEEGDSAQADLVEVVTVRVQFHH